MDMMTGFATPDYSSPENPALRQQLLDDARDLVPILKKRVAASERNRAVPDETIHDLQVRRLLDVCKPTQFGGFALGWDVLCEIAMILAEGCGSTAWLYAVFAEHNNMLTMWSREAQEEVWQEFPDAKIASSKAKTAKLIKADGGYRVSGLATFSSGSHYADWFLSAFVPVEDGGMAFILLPKEDVTVLDTWHAMGMAGTCTNDIEIRDTFVPEHRAFVAGQQPPGWGVHKEPVFRQPRFSMGPYTLASVCVGIAGGFIEEYVGYMRSRVSRFGDAVADFSCTGHIVGNAEARCTQFVGGFDDQIVDNVGHDGIKSRGGLIKEDDFRIGRNGAGQGHIASLFAHDNFHQRHFVDR